jgi:hypothetical protein
MFLQDSQVIWHERIGLSADEALVAELRRQTPSKLDHKRHGWIK